VTLQTSRPDRANLLTQAAFDRLLAALDCDREQAGAKYTELREQLYRFFTWRGCPYPEDHADETLNRTARRLASGEQIADVRGYAFGVARLLVLEVHRQEERKRLALAALPTTDEASEDTGEEEMRLHCLQYCLLKLSQGNRELIIQYYQGERSAKITNRQQLAAKLNLSLNTLRMRALRLREGLESCMRDCVKLEEDL
jgi:DNA-directed RNA polymerase specialized sigma24 family protein